VAQLLELVPDYDALFGLDPTAPTSRDGVDNWGAELDRAGWSGPLLRFKLAVLRRAGRGPVIRWASTGWARRLRRAIPRRLLKTFLAALNAALGSLGAIPGVDRGRGQLSRHPHPWLAKNRPGVAPERRR